MSKDEKIEKVSDILNDMGVYRAFDRLFGGGFNPDNTQYCEIEEYIVDKYLEMSENDEEEE